MLHFLSGKRRGGSKGVFHDRIDLVIIFRRVILHPFFRIIALDGVSGPAIDLHMIGDEGIDNLVEAKFCQGIAVIGKNIVRCFRRIRLLYEFL